MDEGRGTRDEGKERAAEGQVLLGGKVYVLRRKTLRQASAMRRRVAEVIDPAMQLVSAAGSIQIRDVEQLGVFVATAKDLLVESTDILFGLLCEYEATINAEREWLLDHAYDQEVMEAAIAMLRQLFPFGALVQSLSGLAESGISKS